MKEKLKDELAKTIRNYNSKGWSPATSTNYSFRTDDDLERIYISCSGVDKHDFQKEDFMEVDRKGEAMPEYFNLKPSAETLIHCTIYDMFPEAKTILHSHSVYPVMWSMELNNKIICQGYEIQKGFGGQRSHEPKIEIPIIDNCQDMLGFSDKMKTRQIEIEHHCFIIRGHGTYAWGKNLFEAKRHLETLDYLCELEWKRSQKMK
jgi:methylthioribulose-1-phosphate dehydratase